MTVEGACDGAVTNGFRARIWPVIDVGARVERALADRQAEGGPSGAATLPVRAPAFLRELRFLAS
ncbi:MAG: hypothetical protein OEY23_07090 [Acidimicrobiia bacterium]|nr:hypothetical protein [Acidimicrobiia bacterium]